MKDIRQHIIKLPDILTRFTLLSLLLAVGMLLVRIIFAFEVHFRLSVPFSQFPTILSGFMFDLLLVARITTWLLLPFILFSLFFPKTTSRVYVGFIFVYIFASTLLTEYFCNLNMPLDHVVLVYSPEEVMGTASSSAKLTWPPVMLVLISMGLFTLLAWVWKRVKIKPIISYFILGICILATFCLSLADMIREERYYDNHRDFCLAVNQPSYSVVKITDYLRSGDKGFQIDSENTMPENVKQASEHWQSLFPNYNFTDPDYPFYHEATDADVLGDLLRPTSDSMAPNLVFFIIEGFGQRLTGVENPSLSFTPFIDSLKQQSLYWPNCLSSGQRTFAVLPAVFGSTPFGPHGFCHTTDPVPDHQSLLKDLKDNGYYTSYYYGGINSFDRYDAFLKANDVDYIYVPENVVTDSALFKDMNDCHGWGLFDAQTFAQARQHKDTSPNHQPYLDILMTLSTHEPFTIPNIEQYYGAIDAIVAAHPEASTKEKENVAHYKDIFACFYYMDQCVKEMMNYYASRPEYESTIFVITGDHRMAFLDYSNTIRKYNVPLLIYSPLLKQAKTMEAVVGHIDIAPTFDTYLSHNYPYTISNHCHWIGTSLDTTSQFRCQKHIPFILNNRDVIDYVSNDYFISYKRLFHIEKDLFMTPIFDRRPTDSLQAELDDYNLISPYAVVTNHLNKTDSDKVGTLADYQLDFTHTSLAIFRKFMQHEDDEDFVVIDSTVKYAPICPNIQYTGQQYKNLMIDLNFDLRSMDTTSPLPILIVETSGGYYLSASLQSSDGTSLNTGCDEHFHFGGIVPIDEAETNGEMKLYLWNQSKVKFRYDNLQVHIAATLR